MHACMCVCLREIYQHLLYRKVVFTFKQLKDQILEDANRHQVLLVKVGKPDLS